MYCIIITNKWTSYKYIHPRIYYSEFDANKAILGWDSKNSTFEIKPVRYV